MRYERYPVARMSEYQYYEFLAIEKSLSRQDIAALRSLTSSARITSSSLINTYNYGDFRGDPDRLVDKYFDAFLYVANWGSRRLSFRVPKSTFALATAQPYCVDDNLEARVTATHVILDFRSEREGGDAFEGGEGWLTSLLPLRADLMAGDLRCLYLAWLAAKKNNQISDEEKPPTPPKIGRLSASLQRFAEFLRVSP